MKWYLEGQILASKASWLQIGASNCSQREGSTKKLFATAVYTIQLGQVIVYVHGCKGNVMTYELVV